MDALQCRSRGQEALARAAYPFRKLIFIHTGVMLAASLAVTLLSYLLAYGMGSTGGLGGLGDRAILETGQQLLQLASSLLLPFWQIGLTAAAIALIRGRNFGPQSLLAGFGSFGPVLRMYLLQGVICFVVLMVASQVASTVYMLTPMAQELYALMEQLEATGAAVTDLLTLEVLLDMMLGMLPFLLGVSLLFLIPVLYRLRMMPYVVMDTPRLGAFYALRLSLYMTRKNCWKLFRLDLSFWWFYALEALTVVLSFGYELLTLAEVTLPVDGELASFLFGLLAIACQLGLYVWKKETLTAAYAAAYEALLPLQAQQMRTE